MNHKDTKKKSEVGSPKTEVRNPQSAIRNHKMLKDFKDS